MSCPPPDRRPHRRRWAQIVVALLLAALAGPSVGHAASACPEPVKPPLSIIHFFDWYADRPINGPDWTHQVDWTAYGLRPEDVGGSRASYDVQLGLIDALGVDALTYEYYDAGGSSPPLSPAFLGSLAEHRVKLGLMYDLELEQVWKTGPVLSSTDYIEPTEDAARALAQRFANFYRRVPRVSWFVDRSGRLPIFVYGYGFDRESQDVGAWDRFYSALLVGVESELGIEPVVYWSAINRVQQEIGFQHFPDQIRPFNFVVDVQHPQLAPGSVTWNVNFDNLGVQRHFGYVRAVRDDPRYLEEMLWLAKHTAPELVFIYGWNEFYEGANIMPDLTYGTSRYELVEAMLEDVRNNATRTLPCTLLVVDDYADSWTNDDWRLRVEENMTLYPLRRLAPQADVVLASNVTPGLLAGYDLIVVVAQHSHRAVDLAARAMSRKQVVFLGPAMAGSRSARVSFASRLRRTAADDFVPLIGPHGRALGSLFVHDDVFSLTPARGVATRHRVRIQHELIPVLLRRGDDWWMNAFTTDDRVLAALFSSIYGRPLEQGIMYGEGGRSQRIEITPEGKVTRVTFEAPAAFEHDPLPVPWNPPPPELP